MATLNFQVKPNRAMRELQQSGAERMKARQRNFVRRATFDTERQLKRLAPRVEGHLVRGLYSDLKQLNRLRARVRGQEVYTLRVNNLSGSGGKGSTGRRGPRFVQRGIAIVEEKLPRFWREEMGKLLDGSITTRFRG